ncbi:DNA polymerase III subunit delta [Sphingomicrobium nitratireducens]|uniref:DNA polymerase III subunit delta n=1 Tax=Sphingomicrobium nitratireducens TaxID=2964666 RepID=UPI002240A780|nr:DNA polymerase III subunit delta [Sphingomicrobium nitratireducens]
MKIQRGGLDRALASPDPAVRFYLFHGADEPSSRAHAETLLEGLRAEKEVLDAATIRSDPARLADEANAISMFGGRRLLWIEPAGDEILPGVEALFEAPGCEHPVVAIAGALRKTSKLLKAAEASPRALSNVSYALEGRQFEELVERMARDEGLEPEPGVVARIAGMCNANRALAAQEVAKYALYAEPHAGDSSRPLTHDMVDRLGAGSEELELFALGDRAMVGDIRAVQVGLDQLSVGGSEAITILRAMQRRIVMLSPMVARINAGEAPSGVMASMGNAIFFREKPAVSAMLMAWRGDRLERLAERVIALEEGLMLEGRPARTALGQELLTVARTARSARR